MGFGQLRALTAAMVLAFAAAPGLAQDSMDGVWLSLVPHTGEATRWDNWAPRVIAIGNGRFDYGYAHPQSSRAAAITMALSFLQDGLADAAPCRPDLAARLGSTDLSDAVIDLERPFVRYLHGTVDIGEGGAHALWPEGTTLPLELFAWCDLWGQDAPWPGDAPLAIEWQGDALVAEDGTRFVRISREWLEMAPGTLLFLDASYALSPEALLTVIDAVARLAGETEPACDVATLVVDAASLTQAESDATLDGVAADYGPVPPLSAFPGEMELDQAGAALAALREAFAAARRDHAADLREVMVAASDHAGALTDAMARIEAGDPTLCP